jgi:molybdenum cofactor biosynthesis enzyme
MNASKGNVSVALTGRVPCQVQGPVEKGTVLVSSSVPGVAQALNTQLYVPGCVIGKSLETIEDDMIKTIEIAVGRF